MKKKEICVLCGVREASRNGDHLPPQSLYPPPRKPNIELHKVPACKECNNPAGKDDEEFKIIIGLSTGEFRANGSDIIDSMGRTIGKNNRIARQLFSTKNETFSDRGTGIMEPVVAVTFEPTAYSNVISRMVRGLFWRQTGKIMHSTTVIRVIPEFGPPHDLVVSFKELMASLISNFLNDGTFAYKFFLDEEGATFWCMQFFGKHTAYACTEPNEYNKSFRATALHTPP